MHDHGIFRTFASMNTIKKIILATLLALVSLVLKAQTQQLALFGKPVKYEVRAVWLTTIGGIDWPHSYARSGEAIAKQQKELCDILDKLKVANVNTILIQARVRGTTIYESNYEPWDGCLSGRPGQSPGYDALTFAINECHKRGMECHAWIVSIPVGKWNGAGAKNLRSTHPELLKKVGDEAYMNPDHSGTAPYIAKICKEIVENYDIDGIHLDYIRYPEAWPGLDTKNHATQNQRRENITRIVREVHDAVKSSKPWIKMSCSPVGKFKDVTRYSSRGWNAYDKVYQDAQGWLRDGLMDQLYPMMYFRGDHFYPFAADWAEKSYGKTVVPGLGIYFLDPREGKWQREEVTREMFVTRTLGLGHAYFRSDFFTRNTKGIYDYTCKYIDPYPALIPPMTWASNKKPAQPYTVNVTKTSVSGNDEELTISWRGATPYYNIYRSETHPVDITDARNLIAQRVEANQLSISKSGEAYFAITGMDRYGNESDALQSILEPSSRQSLLANDGKHLVLPQRVIESKNLSNADMVVMESLQGQMIATRRMTRNQKTIDISQLPDGVYYLKTLDKKGITHRLGEFTIKRQ